MDGAKEIDSETLRTWLETGKEVSILDVRPIQERAEWFIPGSIHINAYDKLKAGRTDAFDGLYLNKNVPVVTFCAGGKTSLVAANLLNSKGFEAYSLQGGMKAWNLAWNTAKISFPDFDIIQFRRTGKGCLSYLIVSNNQAVVVDASLPVEVYQEYVARENLNLQYVVETHIHADHISRSKQLAEQNQAALYLPVPNQVKFEFLPVKDGMAFNLGRIKLTAIATPGHTMESTSYLVDGKVLLTGDTLFINGVGRPDLKANQEQATEKLILLFQSIRKLLALEDDIIVLPGHSSQPVDFDHIPIQTTIGHIRKNNPLLQLDEAAFIAVILARIPSTPANYLAIVEKNLSGNFSEMLSADLEAGANRCAIT